MSSTKTLSGAYTAGYSLSPSYTGVRITSAAMILGTAGTPGYGLVGSGGNGGDALIVANYAVIRNAGLIKAGAGGAGTDGSVTVSGGRGGDGGVGARLTGIVINNGTIEGGAGGHGGSASGYYYSGVYGGGGGNGGAGVYLAAGTLTNHGVILGGVGGAGGASPFQGGGAGQAGFGAIIEPHASLVNFGSIDSGVTLHDASLSNGSGAHRAGVINGVVSAQASSIANFGSIGGAVYATNSQVMNYGSIGGTVHAYNSQVTNFGTIDGYNGVFSFVTAQVTNANLIHGDRYGVVLLGSGSLVVNQANATIEGGWFGVTPEILYGVMTVVNFGTISGSLCSVNFRGGASRLIVEKGSMLIGTAFGARGTLELAAGGGAITGIGSHYYDFGTMEVDAGGVWRMSGVNTLGGDLTNQSGARLRLGGSWDPFGGTTPTAGIGVIGALTNDGILTVAGAELSVTGAVSGRGTVMINDGLAFFQSDVSQTVRFGTAGGELMLSSAETFTGRITGFSSAGLTTLDLRDIGFASTSEATFSGNTKSGVLTVSDGTTTAQFRLLGDFTGATWVTADDGAGGVAVVAGPSTTTRVPGFASAMASFAPANHTASATALDLAKSPAPLVLVSPGH